MKFMRTLWKSFKNRRGYTLAQLPAGVVLVMTMFTIAQAWFWTITTTEFGKLFIAEYDKYGPFYWKALFCALALFCLGFLALMWSTMAIHLQQNLQKRIFQKA
ncbi:hypothetical protein D3C87_544320 [compost metagenome]|uniref:hypothetical protein n=1 Tax=Achromobacter sp. Root83 TaxID=1736602 RepID=UPI000708E2EB|nr:hypothetical protein [Achromobacter sp. Root83]KRC70152.1 hypothetical protein ASE30_16785 [Achromobacter sp. Root83]